MLTPKFLAASVIALGLASGQVTRAELAMIPDLAQQFERFDADQDGKLDRAEFAALMTSMK